MADKNFTVDFVTISGKATNNIDTIKDWVSQPGARVADSVTFPNGKAVQTAEAVEEQAEEAKPTPKKITGHSTALLSTVRFRFGMDTYNVDVLEDGSFSVEIPDGLSGYSNLLMSNNPSITDVDLSEFDTSNITGFNAPFEGCSGLTSLDLSTFNVLSIGGGGPGLYCVFKDCTSLKSVDLSNWVLPDGFVNIFEVFLGCSSLESVKVENCPDATRTKILNQLNTDKPGGHTWKLEGDTFVPVPVPKITGTRIDDINKPIININGVAQEVVVDGLNWYVEIPEGDITSLESFTYKSKHANYLASIDVSTLDTSSVTTMSRMFYGCSGLASLDVSNFDTSSVTTMYQMFYGCSGLTSLDVSNFDTSSVVDMTGMFDNCSGLTSLDVSGFDTSSVTTMSQMFYFCNGITSLDVSTLDTSSVTIMYQMFRGCTGLTSLDLSTFDTSSVTTMQEMFDGCADLVSIDLSNFDMSGVTSTLRMFLQCNNLASVKVANCSEATITKLVDQLRTDNAGGSDVWRQEGDYLVP